MAECAQMKRNLILILYCHSLKVPSVEGRTTESWEFCGHVGWNLHFPDKEPENQQIIN